MYDASHPARSQPNWYQHQAEILRTEMALTHDGEHGLPCLDNASVSASCLHHPQPLSSAGTFLHSGSYVPF